MKTLFIPAKFKSNVNKDKIAELTKRLPKNLSLAYSIQFKDIALEIRDILTKQGHIIHDFLQVLGCSKPQFKESSEAVLLISTGKFHAVSLAYESQVPIYILDKNKLEQITKSDIELIVTKQKASYLRFLNADSIGILVSTKPGQSRLKKAFNLKKQLKKNSYLFLSNNINVADLENFPDIDSWVNTACPRLDMDSSRIINIDKLNLK